MFGSVSQGAVVSLSDMIPPLHQCLQLEQIPLGSQKYTCSLELRRALSFSLGSASEDHSFRVSSNKLSSPVATEELRHLKENLLDASIKAKERSKMFCESLYKLDKYTDAMGSKKRQRSELLSNEKPAGSSLLKIPGHAPRNLVDRSTHKIEEKGRLGGLNKRFRSSAMDSRVDGRSGSLSKDQINNEKKNVTKPVVGASVQPEERMRQLSAVGEGWDRKMKRKRSVGTVANRSSDSDVKGIKHAKLSTESKLAASDVSASRSNANQGKSTTSPSTVIKGKISRAPRSGSVMAVNSSSDVQTSSEAFEGWEQPTSTNKVMSLGLMQGNQRAAASSHRLGGWGGQRQQKSSRSRRVNVVSPVSNHDEGQVSSLSFTPPDIGARNSFNGALGGLDIVDNHNNAPKNKMKFESTSPARLSESDEIRNLEHKLEAKGTGCGDAVMTGRGKVRSFIIPTKRNKIVVNDNNLDGVRKQGRTMRGLPSSRPGISQCEANSENASMMKAIPKLRPGSDKIKSKSGRPPSKKMLDGRILTRVSESDDDHEELLAAAASARKANNLSCSDRFWKKMEPIFGPVTSQDSTYLKHQLNFAAELEDSLSHMSGPSYNILGIFMHKETASVLPEKRDSNSFIVVDKEEVIGERKSDKFSGLYQRLLSALIEEDECEGVYNGNEGLSMSFQCASDDSHCGSCNYADAETRDRDRLESEAESIIDFQIQKRCAGDKFSCNRSVTSNTTRNGSMSDSLYSSGRWLGDDGLSHSDVEFVSGSFHHDQVAVQPADLANPGALSDSQYQLMCVDDKLMLELQSIGLCLDTMPDLAEGEVIYQDITELSEGLCEQVGKKKHKLMTIDKAIQDDKEREKRHVELVAMEQLIQMAYKQRMACRRNNASRTVMRKVSKPVAMGFIERTLARCKTFELTGRSCFSEPALQKVIFEPPQSSDAGGNISIDVNACRGVPNHRSVAAKTGITYSTSQSMLDCCTDDLGRGSVESPQTGSHSSEHGFSKFETVLPKGKKRELLLDDIGATFSRGATGCGPPIAQGATGKRSERERDHNRGILPNNSATENQLNGRPKTELKQKLKPHQNPASNAQAQPTPSSIQLQNTGNNRGREMGLACAGKMVVEDGEEIEDPIDFSSLPMPDFDSLEQLGVSNDPNGPEDIGSWFDGLQEDGSDGLHIPMDDLSMINL